MPILKYRTLLLLTMFTFLAVAGRNIPAAVPSTAIFAPTTKVKLTPTRKLWFGVVSWAQSGSQSQLQDMNPSSNTKTVRGNKKNDLIYEQRLLVGSSPPSCAGKCGPCTPCRPIHVSVGSPHARSVTEHEYYPEVWRCKCKNNLYEP
ncbi:polygalacturonase isoform X1 [Physcomitrium patens]|uniref:Epidermal patterning factor-like protein n=1 Tax=Physcomitrium patens TaxID=3218 RepID=A0A7I4B7Z6_PHYPA|nr:EPIDERMAL PATTERNING FACTOR-like protein 3 isoform X1 [Physcomitrium patens]|eukprot:XP_024400483.1 EPIDERMAL PATTERNING FACTOR-like protein 3 isoform X1 [Physcomitrella patens]